jgi:hypothetical protein
MPSGKYQELDFFRGGKCPFHFCQLGQSPENIPDLGSLEITFIPGQFHPSTV